jgi:hypothetical protein
VVSPDRTTIAFDRSGEGPPVVLVGAGPTDRAAQQPLAALLTPQLTVYNYDRRGDMVELFLTQAAGMPAAAVAPIRQSPFWPSMEAWRTRSSTTP